VTGPGTSARITRVERHGINTIPDADRTSGPIDLFRIQFGGANTFATVILGTTPVMLGLSLPAAVAATVLGVVVGALILAPMGLFAPRTGTNNAVSSGAHLGVRGRIVGGQALHGTGSRSATTRPDSRRSSARGGRAAGGR
jgi:purine-cytosine permease-like protein